MEFEHSSQDGVFNPYYLRELEETLGRDYIDNFLNENIPEIAGYIEQIQSFSKNNEMINAGRKAHEIKTVSGFLGMTGLQTLAENVEDYCEEGRGEEAKSLISGITDCFNENVEALRKLYPE